MSAGNYQVAETDTPPPHQPSPDGASSATPPQRGSDWTVERARAYLARMDPKIADLFPDRLVNSEIGEIPEGMGGWLSFRYRKFSTKEHQPGKLGTWDTLNRSRPYAPVFNRPYRMAKLRKGYQ